METRSEKWRQKILMLALRTFERVATVVIPILLLIISHWFRENLRCETITVKFKFGYHLCLGYVVVCWYVGYSRLGYSSLA
eukprot:scaffold3199_cov54-Attheya_sp.AAC.4